jgi:two-component system response regulator CpxR
MEQVLMVDDDTELCEMVTEYLAPEGFAVTAAHDGPAGIEQARSGAFALVLLDVMLPGLNGFEVLRRLRAAETSGTSVPVLILTARGNAVDRIVGLEVGADDYLPKPFDERELVARMRAILRRTTSATNIPADATPARETLKLEDVTLDLSARVATCNGTAVPLTAVEFDLLAMLLRASGQVVSREQIMRDILDRKLMSFDRSVDTHISRLRRKLGPHAQGEERIKTIRGIGYVYTLPQAREYRS